MHRFLHHKYTISEPHLTYSSTPFARTLVWERSQSCETVRIYLLLAAVRKRPMFMYILSYNYHVANKNLFFIYKALIQALSPCPWIHIFRYFKKWWHLVYNKFFCSFSLHSTLATKLFTTTGLLKRWCIVHISYSCSTFVQSGERLSDGAFSPRDHKHGSGEEHNNAFDHEAILGSRKDAEEYDDLPPEEAKKRLRVSDSKQVWNLIGFASQVLLGKMDRNLDEQIDRKELYAWILRSFKYIFSKLNL